MENFKEEFPSLVLACPGKIDGKEYIIVTFNLPEDTPIRVPFMYNDFHVMIEYVTSEHGLLSVNYSSGILTKRFLPDQVQMILNECGFDPNDVSSWKEHIEVPIGVNTKYFIAREGIINGLKVLNTLIYPELDGYGEGVGSIPDFVSTNYQLATTENFVQGVRQTFPSEMLTYKWKFRKNTDFNEIIRHIISRRNKNININNLLYRGIRRYRDIPRLLRYGFFPRNPELSDFGDGFYTTPSIVYALKHIRSVGNGALLIFNWKDSGGRNVTTKYIDGDEWISTVKGHICVDDITKPGPPIHSEDILVGAISDNYDEIVSCSKPESSNFTQVVGITPAGWKSFEERLIAIIYIYS